MNNSAARVVARRGLFTAGTRIRWETLSEWLHGLDLMLAQSWRHKQISTHVCALAEVPEVIRVADRETCQKLLGRFCRWSLWSSSDVEKHLIVEAARARLSFLNGEFFELAAPTSGASPSSTPRSTPPASPRSTTPTPPASGASPRSTTPTPPASGASPTPTTPWARYAEQLRRLGVREYGSPMEQHATDYYRVRCRGCERDMAIVPCSCTGASTSCGHCYTCTSLPRCRWACFACEVMVGGGEAALMWKWALAELRAQAARYDPTL